MATVAVNRYLLLESGDFLLQEDGVSKIILYTELIEDDTATPFTLHPRTSQFNVKSRGVDFSLQERDSAFNVKNRDIDHTLQPRDKDYNTKPR